MLTGNILQSKVRYASSLLLLILINSCQNSGALISSPSKETVQIQPVNSSVTPIIESKVNGKNVYPPEAIANYIDVCTRAGGSKDECKCFITKAQDFYTLDELIKINQEVSLGRPNPEKILSITSQCEQPKSQKTVPKKAENLISFCVSLQNKYMGLETQKIELESKQELDKRVGVLDYGDNVSKIFDIKQAMSDIEYDYVKNDCKSIKKNLSIRGLDY